MPSVDELVRFVAGRPAGKYFEESIARPLSAILGLKELTPEGVREHFADPTTAFSVLLSHYILKPQDGYASEVGIAIQLTLGESAFEEWLDSGDGEALWLSFLEASTQTSSKPAERDNMLPLLGACELLCELSDEPNIWIWIVSEVRETGMLSAVSERLLEIRGFGPKNAGRLLRDAVFLWDVEDCVVAGDRHLLQPITAAVRAVCRASGIVGDERVSDWNLAGNLAELCDGVGVSGARFNMGAEHLGRDKRRLQEALNSMAEG